MSDAQRETSEWVECMAQVVGISLDSKSRSGVVANFEAIARLAELVMEFPLPDDVEAAPTFDPKPLSIGEITANGS